VTATTQEGDVVRGPYGLGDVRRVYAFRIRFLIEFGLFIIPKLYRISEMRFLLVVEVHDGYVNADNRRFLSLCSFIGCPLNLRVSFHIAIRRTLFTIARFLTYRFGGQIAAL